MHYRIATVGVVDYDLIGNPILYLQRMWEWGLRKGRKKGREREKERVVLSKSTFKGLLLRVAAVSEVRRGSLSTTIFHNAMERRDAVGDDDDDFYDEEEEGKGV